MILGGFNTLIGGPGSEIESDRLRYTRIEGSKNVPGGHFSKVKNFDFFF